MIKLLAYSGIASLIIATQNDNEAYPYIEGISILFACLFITTLSAFCEWGKNNQYKMLHEAIRDEEVAVIRGIYGHSQTCKVVNVVVGDIIAIEAGMKIPADCILLDGQDVVCDETMYTSNEGKPNLVQKKISTGTNHEANPDPFLLSRSLVTSGSGRAVVCAVGTKTRWFMEHPIEDLEDDNEKTPLSQRLGKLANYIE